MKRELCDGWPQETKVVSAVYYGIYRSKNPSIYGLLRFDSILTQACEEPKTKAFSAGIWLSKSSFLLKILSDEQSCSCQNQNKESWEDGSREKKFKTNSKCIDKT